MSEQICGNCYKSTTFKYARAKFCSHCGNDFNLSFSNASASQPLQTTNPNPPRDNDVKDDVHRWDGLDLRVEASFGREMGIKVKDLAAGGDGGSLERRPETRSAKEVMDEFKKKSSTTGKTIEVD